MTDTPTPTPNEAQPSTHQRRSREEVEALAKSFVATPTGDVPPVKPHLRIAMAAGAVVVVVALVAFFWPKGRVERDTTAADQAAAEAEQWKARFEAEKERKRKELEAGQDYLQRIAASDAELLKDMTSRAEKLAQRAAAFAPEEPAPSPREESTRTASAAPAPKPAPATTTAAATPAPAKAPPQASTPAPAPAPATQTAKAAPAQTAPQTVAQAAPSSCRIHVSELSSSGKLTYDGVKRMKGARFDESSGSVFTPPVQVSGKPVVFEVLPNGCVQVVRSAMRLGN